MEVQYLPKIEGSSSPEFDHPCCSARFLSDHLTLHRLICCGYVKFLQLFYMAYLSCQMKCKHIPLTIPYICNIVRWFCCCVCLLGVFLQYCFFLSTENFSFLYSLFVCLFVWLCFIVIVYLGGYQLLQLQSFVWVVVFPIVSLVGTEWKRSCKVAQDFNNHCFFK